MDRNGEPQPASRLPLSGNYLTRWAPGRWPRWLAYVMAVVLVAATLLIRISITEIYGDRPLLIIFVLPIIISAYLGGLGPGLVATLAASLGVDYFLAPPLYTLLTFHKYADLAQWLLLIVNGIAISVLIEALRRSWEHEKSSLLLQAVTLASIGDAVITTDPQGRITFLNPEAVRLTGWGHEEALGLPLAEVFRIINEKTRETVTNSVNAVLASGKTQGLANHTVLLTRNGRECPIADSGAPIRDERGNILGAVLVFHDCTAQRQAEQTLRENREDLNRAQAVAHTGSWRMNVLTDELTWSEENHRIFGIPPDTPMTYETFLNAVHPEDRDYVDGKWMTALKGEPYDLEHRIVVNGAVKWLRERAELEFDQEGHLLGGFGTTQDITAPKQAEAALRRSESSYRLLFDTMGQGVVFQEADGKITVMNPAAERILGRTAAEFVGETSKSVEHHTIRPDGSPYPGQEHPTMVALRTGEEVHNQVMGIYNPREGGYRWININAVPLVRNPGEPPYQVYAVFDDITARLQAEATLAASRSKLEAALASMTDAVFISDAQGRFIDFNEAFATFHQFKSKDECATSLAEYPALFEVFLPGGEPAPLEQWAVPRALRGETAANAEYTLKRKDTGATWVGSYSFAPIRDQDGVIVGAVLTARDITEQKRAAEALARSLAEKTALLQEVHHRVKNNLQIVASLLSLQASRTPHPEVLRVLEDTRQRVHSMALLHEALYRSDNLARINFAAYVEALCRHLRRAAGPVAARVAVDTCIAPLGLPLEQSLPCGLIINELVSNAMKHAFPDDRQGRVTVTMGPAPDGHLLLRVADDGVGPPAFVDLVKTPTLGLRLVHGLASQLRGKLTVEQPNGHGLAFQIIFPIPNGIVPEDQE